jgi:hypothetical protein
MKQLLLDLHDAVKYWCGETAVAESRLEDARVESARVLYGVTQENHRLRVMVAELQVAGEARAQLEARIRTLQKERRFFICALGGVCVGFMVVCLRLWRM